MGKSRREFVELSALGIVASGFSGSLYAADPWDTKPVAELSEKDIEKLMNKSPWAKKVAVDTGRGPSTLGGPATAPARGGRGGSGGGGPQGGGGGGADIPEDAAAGPGGGAGAAAPEALVRWESARPVLEAQKRAAPEVFQGHYAISVAGFPVGGGGPRPGAGGPGGPPGGPGGGFDPQAMKAAQQAALDKGKETTRLERKGKDPIHPSVIGLAGRALLILFPRGTQPIEPEDKDVTLVLQIGLPTLKVKFNLKDMMYQGKLEL